MLSPYYIYIYIPLGIYCMQLCYCMLQVYTNARIAVCIHLAINIASMVSILGMLYVDVYRGCDVSLCVYVP